MDQAGLEQNQPRPMRKYVIKAVEDVYDAFDEYEHQNELDPFTIEAPSLGEALRAGDHIARDRNDERRKSGGFWSSGTFNVSVVEIANPKGTIVYQLLHERDPSTVVMQQFWDAIPTDPFGNPSGSGSCMYRRGDRVIFECVDVDHEDNRTYSYSLEFPLDRYRAALATLQSAGSAEVQGADGSMRLRKDGESIELVLSGTPSPGATPGGASLHGTIHQRCALDTLEVVG